MTELIKLRKLPDISDLLEDRENLKHSGLIIKDTKEYYKREMDIANAISERYNAAGITKEDCDHPAWRVVENEYWTEYYCRCCSSRVTSVSIADTRKKLYGVWFLPEFF